MKPSCIADEAFLFKLKILSIHMDRHPKLLKLRHSGETQEIPEDGGVVLGSQDSMCHHSFRTINDKTRVTYIIQGEGKGSS